jgi:hypothetical protein
MLAGPGTARRRLSKNRAHGRKHRFTITELDQALVKILTLEGRPVDRGDVQLWVVESAAPAEVTRTAKRIVEKPIARTGWAGLARPR